MITLTFRIKGDEEYLNKLMTFYCHTYNVMVKHARGCLNNLKRDRRYRELMTNYKENETFTSDEKNELKDLRLKYGLSKNDFEKYLKLQSKLKIAHSAIVQKVAERVWLACEKYLFGNGKAIHFKKRREFCSFEAKTIQTGIKLDGNHIAINKHNYQIIVRKKDEYAKSSLKHKISYCRVLRKWHKNSWRYYVQLIIDAPGKEVKCANGTVGIDISPSTIAVNSENGSFINKINEIESAENEIAVLNRKIDVLRRKNNPQNYNPDGTAKRHVKWNKNKAQIKLENKRKELYRKKREKTKLSNNLLAKYILTLGNVIIVEDMQFSALQKRAKETTKNKNGRFNSKKRFGKSILENAPANFIQTLKYNIQKAGGTFIEVDCFKTCATQFDHTSGAYYKHSLNERFIMLDNGILIQRDLHSAFNLRHLIINEQNCYAYNIDLMNLHFDDFKNRHDNLIQDLKVLKYQGIKIPSSII